MKLKKSNFTSTKKKYEVIVCCDHRGCNYSKSKHILYAITMNAARENADRLNKERDNLCPKCRRTMGFFPVDHTIK